MKPEIISFKSAEEVIRIHDNIIQEFGGRHGILNMGLLESAINQPFNVWLYETKNNRKIYNLAAAYFYHIIKNHPFIDGNKRTGLLTAVEFIYNNGYELKKQYRDMDDLYELAIDTASSKLTTEDIAIFFKKAIKKIK